MFYCVIFNAIFIAIKSALAKLGKTDPKSVTDEEWKKVLSPEEYEVTRQAGTEPKGTGKYNNVFVTGKYTCKCCGIELFVYVLS